MQTDRRFSYFPPEFTQQILPNGWEPMGPPPPNQNPNITSTAPIINMSTMSDPSYFMQPISNFGPHLYAEQNYDMPDREGSLSQQQQAELMQSLETDGLSGIDSYLGLSPVFFDPTKR